MNTVARMDAPMSMEQTCAICGKPDGHRKQCPRKRGLICPEHCDGCTFWNDATSVGICTFGVQEYEQIRALDHGRGLSLCSCRMWRDKESGRYIIAVGRHASHYIVWPSTSPMEAVDSLLREADGFAAVAAHAARRGRRADALDIDMLESRGVAMKGLWDGLYEVRRIPLTDGQPVRREVFTDPLEAWQSFREALRIRLQTAIEQTAIEAKEA